MKVRHAHQMVGEKITKRLEALQKRVDVLETEMDRLRKVMEVSKPDTSRIPVFDATIITESGGVE